MSVARSNIFNRQLKSNDGQAQAQLPDSVEMSEDSNYLSTGSSPSIISTGSAVIEKDLKVSNIAYFNECRINTEPTEVIPVAAGFTNYISLVGEKKQNGENVLVVQGNLKSLEEIAGGSITTTGGITGTSVNASTITATGEVNASTISATDLNVSTITATGEVNVSTISATDLNVSTITATSTVSAPSISATGETGTVSAKTITATSTVSAPSISATGSDGSMTTKTLTAETSLNACNNALTVSTSSVSMSKPLTIGTSAAPTYNTINGILEVTGVQPSGVAAGYGIKVGALGVNVNGPSTFIGVLNAQNSSDIDYETDANNVKTSNLRTNAGSLQVKGGAVIAKNLGVIGGIDITGPPISAANVFLPPDGTDPNQDPNLVPAATPVAIKSLQVKGSSTLTRHPNDTSTNATFAVTGKSTFTKHANDGASDVALTVTGNATVTDTLTCDKLVVLSGTNPDIEFKTELALVNQLDCGVLVAPINVDARPGSEVNTTIIKANNGLKVRNAANNGDSNITCKDITLSQTKSPNNFFAGPVSGSSAAAPTWRSIAMSDLPTAVQTVSNLPTTTVTNNTFYAAPNGQDGNPSFRPMAMEDMPDRIRLIDENLLMNVGDTTVYAGPVGPSLTFTSITPNTTTKYFTVAGEVLYGLQPQYSKVQFNKVIGGNVAANTDYVIHYYTSTTFQLKNSDGSILTPANNTVVSTVVMGFSTKTAIFRNLYMGDMPTEVHVMRNDVANLTATRGNKNFYATPTTAGGGAPVFRTIVFEDLPTEVSTMQTDLTNLKTSRAAKQFYAAPTAAAGIPSFRTIASDDLPTTITGTQTTKTFFAGPTTVNGQPAFRNITEKDLPGYPNGLNYNSTVNGLFLGSVFYSAISWTFTNSITTVVPASGAPYIQLVSNVANSPQLGGVKLALNTGIVFNNSFGGILSGSNYYIKSFTATLNSSTGITTYAISISDTLGGGTKTLTAVSTPVTSIMTVASFPTAFRSITTADVKTAASVINPINPPFDPDNPQYIPPATFEQNSNIAILDEVQVANTILAAPDGSSGTPSFRALTWADMPTPPSIDIATDGDQTIDAYYKYVSWRLPTTITSTAVTLNVTNLTPGKSVTIHIRNRSTTITKTINFLVNGTTVVLAPSNNSPSTYITQLSIVPNYGVACIKVFNAAGWNCGYVVD